MSDLEISPEQFHRLAAHMVALTSDYLRDLPSLPSFPPQVSGEALDGAAGGS